MNAVQETGLDTTATLPQEKIAMALQGKKAILAVSGGIAAFKALTVVRLLKQHGADPFVVMTAHATQFIAPESFAMWSGHPVSVDLFAPLKTWDMEHIALAHGADLVLVVPATANFLAKFATGTADDLLSTLLVVIAARAPIFLAPAMNTHMYTNEVVQHHLTTLRQKPHIHVIEPEHGRLASTLEGEGVGRLAEPDTILDHVLTRLR
ncbi:MAG: phosphopantothenoylcysteine decarboxylase [Candidatus Tectomicrobia bacterium]|nr:phosphopantothenoylcysteine decarboxylase [Candidatus Tectomicrobia bacterium]